MINNELKIGKINQALIEVLTTESGFIELNSPIDIIFGQVLINPKSINFGTITSKKTASTFLWNATNQKQKMIDIAETNFDGISISGQPSWTFYPGESIEYIVNASAKGGPEVNAKAEFVFQNLDNVELFIFGKRSVFFGFTPNYIAQNVINYSYRTEIQSFWNGNEERRPVYVNSEMMFSNAYTMNESEAREVQNILQNHGSQMFFAPVFQNGTNLKSGVKIGDNIIKCIDVLNFEEGQDILIGKVDQDGEQAQIVSIDTDKKELKLSGYVEKEHHISSRISPILKCQFQENGNSIQKINGEVYEVSLSFQVVDMTERLIADESNSFEQFKGLDILDIIPDGRNIDQSFDFIFEDLKDFGASERMHQMKKAKNGFNYRFVSHYEEIDRIKYFFKSKKGKLKDFLVRSFFNDFKIASDITSADNAFKVENNSSASFNSDSEKRKYLTLRLKDGTVFNREILSKSINSDDTETIVIDEPFGQAIKKEEVESIEYLFHCRFATDTLSIAYWNYNSAEITLNFKSL